jgi:Tfp pilus assembly protein PilV
MRQPSRPTTRPGLSLLEVLVSLTIFLMALAGLTFLLTVAGNTAQEASHRSHALRLCQSKLSEVVAGAVPLQGGGGGPFDEEPAYQWSVDAQNGSVQGLWNVTVKVSHKRADGSQLTVSLSQMVLDPSTAGSTQDTPAGPASSVLSSSGASTTGGSTSGSSSSGM